MPRSVTARRWPDWYTAEMIAEDRGLSGTWYRCHRHGQQSPVDVIAVGEKVYCTGDECTEPALLVSHAMRTDPELSSWNKFDPAKRTRVVTRPRRDAHPPPESRPPPGAEESGSEVDQNGEEGPELVQDEDDVEELEDLVPTEGVDQVDAEGPEVVQREGADMATNGEAIGGRAFVMMELGKGPKVRQEMLKAFAQARPDFNGKQVDGNLDAALFALKKKGRVQRDESGKWSLVDGAPAKPEIAPHLENEPAPRPRRKSKAFSHNTYVPESVVTPSQQPHSNQAKKGETPPPVAVIPARRSITVAVTEPMTARLLELLDTGWHGATIEDVAERYLARALQASRAEP